VSTLFPTALDPFTNPTGANHLNDASVLHSTQHSNLNDAVFALEQKVGIDFSNARNSLDYITNLLLMSQMTARDGTYREVTYVAHPIVASVIWYTDSGKTIKLVQKDYTYGSIKILPIKVTLKLYDGTVSNVLKRTIEDTITYDKVFETSRSRIIT
jgi:hypothetical protein